MSDDKVTITVYVEPHPHGGWCVVVDGIPDTLAPSRGQARNTKAEAEEDARRWGSLIDTVIRSRVPKMELVRRGTWDKPTGEGEQR